MKLRPFDWAVSGLLALLLLRPWLPAMPWAAEAKSYLSDCGVITAPLNVRNDELGL